jgi:hypothetical protein
MIGQATKRAKAKQRRAPRGTSYPLPSLAGDGEAASAFALANPDPSFGSLRRRLAVHIEKRGGKMDRRRQRRAYPENASRG